MPACAHHHTSSMPNTARNALPIVYAQLRLAVIHASLGILCLEGIVSSARNLLAFMELVVDVVPGLKVRYCHVLIVNLYRIITRSCSQVGVYSVRGASKSMPTDIAYTADQDTILTTTSATLVMSVAAHAQTAITASPVHQDIIGKWQIMGYVRHVPLDAQLVIMAQLVLLVWTATISIQIIVYSVQLDARSVLMAQLVRSAVVAFWFQICV